VPARLSLSLQSEKDSLFFAACAHECAGEERGRRRQALAAPAEDATLMLALGRSKKASRAAKPKVEKEAAEEKMRGDATTNNGQQVFLSVAYDFDYEGDGKRVAMREGEILLLISKTNRDWWQVSESASVRHETIHSAPEGHAHIVISASCLAHIVK